MASIPVILAVGTVVNKFLEAWEKIEKIRSLRAQLIDIKLKKSAVDELTDEITTTVDEVVEESTKLIIVNYKGTSGRKNELATAINQDTRRLFGQIERGLTIEFRAEPQVEDKDTDEPNELTAVSDLANKLRFPQITEEPLLLQGGEILEGDIGIVKQSKKTTTHKTTVEKKDGGSAESKS
jgi:hypothetical protein